MKPLLMRSGLTGTVYVITRYKQAGVKIEAQTKYDVTDQFNALVEEMEHDRVTKGGGK